MKNLICFIFLLPLATNCGPESVEYKKPSKKPYQYQAEIDASCNKCHQFRGPLSEGQKNRVRSGTMPPSGKLSEDTKKKLLGE